LATRQSCHRGLLRAKTGRPARVCRASAAATSRFPLRRGRATRPAPRSSRPPTMAHGRAQSRVRRSSWALSATTTVETDMSTAPNAGETTTLAPIATPAASGSARML